jgi:aspartyl/asparaginyl beta-hydroxylase (cupin superfamily)
MAMQLASAVVKLFDHPVEGMLAALPEAASPLWEGARFRQNVYKPHSVTRSIVFDWLDNSWRPGKPFIVLRADYLPANLVAAVSPCAAALERRLNGKVAKLMLAELAPGGEVAEHRDVGPALVMVHRCHLPVVTNKDVSFLVDGEDFYLAPGIAYEFDNTRRHAVRNRSDSRRVHLICDIMPRELTG